ncbi:MAG: glycosyl transferase family 1, partial [Bosea sp. (in: a-proteobacteria)]|nr:glycosyl transferase family 1 [Bosea sp. (in: a-proteobacteria)]
MITEHPAPELPGLRQLAYTVGDASTQHPALVATDYHLRTGEAVAGLMVSLAASDPPDVVIGHTGWGGLLFARDALPDTALLG